MTSDSVVEGDTPPTQSASESAAPRALVQAHWYTVKEAARLLGISEPAIRRRVADRSLTALRLGRGWRILLPGEPRPVVPQALTAPAADMRAPAPNTSEQISQVSESLVTLVRDLQRQNLALAGQIGYLQSQLTRGRDGSADSRTDVGQVAVETTTADTVDRADYEAVLREAAALRVSIQKYEEELAARPQEPISRKKRWWRRGGNL
jgi:excisionase family DNA binding protein